MDRGAPRIQIGPCSDRLGSPKPRIRTRISQKSSMSNFAELAIL
jgi:hypothetical protein